MKSHCYFISFLARKGDTYIPGNSEIGANVKLEGKQAMQGIRNIEEGIEENLGKTATALLLLQITFI